MHERKKWKTINWGPQAKSEGESANCLAEMARGERIGNLRYSFLSEGRKDIGGGR